MSEPAAVMLFPYTTLAPAWADRLARAFGRVILYQPLGQAAPAGLAELVQAGTVELVQPGLGLMDATQVKALLGEAQAWVERTRDLRELLMLRARLAEEAAEGSPSALASAIRGHGRGQADPGLRAHLVLHLARLWDERRAEMGRLLAGLSQQEARLAETWEGGDDADAPFPAALEPLAGPETQEGPLLARRLAAWAELYRAEPRPAGLWLTGPEVLAYLAQGWTERAGAGPEFLGGVDLDALAPGQGSEILSRLRPTSTTGPSWLKLWRFEASSPEELVGLPCGRGPALLAEVALFT